MSDELPAADRERQADRDFIAALESCRLPRQEFGHKNHLRAAYLYLQMHDFGGALTAMKRAIVNYAAHLGKPLLYDEAMTVAFMTLMNEQLDRSGNCGGWLNFATQNPALFDRTLLARYQTRTSKDAERADAGKFRIRTLARLGAEDVRQLSDVLIDCVEDGASVSFMLPMSREKAELFWSSVAVGVERGERVVLVAEDAAAVIVGTAQLIWAQAENQPHRADIAKMLVHRCARRSGLGAALLAAAESSALAAGRRLLVLDSVTGGAGCRLYAAHGWQRCGDIPGYALWPDGALCSTTVFYKTLGD